MNETDNNAQGQKPKISKLAIVSLVLCVLCFSLIGVISRGIGIPVNIWFCTAGLFATLIITSLCVELIALFTIKKKKTQLRGVKLTILCMLFTAFTFVFGLMVTFHNFREVVGMVGCSTQIKSIGWALQLYSSDY
ncbi:MAG: hypothetical protein ACYS0I_02605, partial [Planctomycetota bacterium]